MTLNNNLICQSCGRDFGGDADLKSGAACPSSDCPSLEAITLPRFLTYETYCGIVRAIPESEYALVKGADAHAAPYIVADWVWQYAASAEAAVAAHVEAVDAWQRNPSKETYGPFAP